MVKDPNPLLLNGNDQQNHIDGDSQKNIKNTSASNK